MHLHGRLQRQVSVLRGLDVQTVLIDPRLAALHATQIEQRLPRAEAQPPRKGGLVQVHIHIEDVRGERQRISEVRTMVRAENPVGFLDLPQHSKSLDEVKFVAVFLRVPLAVGL